MTPYLIVLITIGLLVSQRQAYALQYLYFLRYPIAFALLLFFLPILLGEEMANVFALDQPFDFVVVGFFGSLLCWVIVYTGGLIWLRTPDRSDLPFRKSERDRASREREEAAGERNRTGKDLDKAGRDRLRPHNELIGAEMYSQRPYLVFAAYMSAALVLLVPVLWVSVRNSRGEMEGLVMAVSALGGVGLAFAVAAVPSIVRGALRRLNTRAAHRRSRWPASLSRALIGWFHGIERLIDKPAEGYLNGYEPEDWLVAECKRPRAPFNHTRAAAFFALTAVVYLLGFCLFMPDADSPALSDELPVLMYVLLLLMVLPG